MNITIDQQAHAWAGLAIMLGVSLFGGWIAGLVVAVAAGLLKEAYDSMGFGTPDHKDAIATIIGGLVGAGLYLIAGML